MTDLLVDDDELAQAQVDGFIRANVDQNGFPLTEAEKSLGSQFITFFVVIRLDGKPQ